MSKIYYGYTFVGAIDRRFENSLGSWGLYAILHKGEGGQGAGISEGK